MKLSWQMILQAIATIAQIFNAWGAFLPSKYQALGAGVLGGLQVLLGTLAHFYNTDGSPQGTPLPAPAPTTAVTLPPVPAAPMVVTIDPPAASPVVASRVKPPAGGPDIR
jgi:hypothetical protein